MTLILLGGHRGLGCTDHEFYANRNTPGMPVENTLDSLLAAYKGGAAYTEFDVVRTGDRQLIVAHNVVPGDHFFGADKPLDVLNKLPLAEIKRYRTGRNGNGTIAHFRDVLEAVAENDPNHLPWAANIEIKGVQGSSQDYENDDFIASMVEAVTNSSLNPKRILWSSFALENVIRMAGHFPESSYGMLYGEKPESRPIYANHKEEPRYRYLPFNAQEIAFVANEWAGAVTNGAKLGYAHPEITTVNKETIAAAKKHGFGINCWALFEKLDNERLELYRRIAAETGEQCVPFTAITDYLSEMQAL